MCKSTCIFGNVEFCSTTFILHPLAYKIRLCSYFCVSFDSVVFGFILAMWERVHTRLSARDFGGSKLMISKSLTCCHQSREKSLSTSLDHGMLQRI
jgi:hypothetical protein